MKISMLENNDFLVDLSYIYLVVALIEICEEFKWLSQKGGELVSILELLDLTSIGSSEDEMCELAYKIVRDL